MDDMTVQDWIGFAIAAVTFLALATGSLWFAWSLVRMQPRIVQAHYLGTMAVVIAIAAACLVYFTRQPYENEEMAGLVVLLVMLATATGAICYAAWIYKRYRHRMVQWEFIDPHADPGIRPPESTSAVERDTGPEQ